MAKYHKMGIFFLTNALVALCHTLLLLTLNFKMCWFQKKQATELKRYRYQFILLMPDEDKKTFIGGSLVLDFSQ